MLEALRSFGRQIHISQILATLAEQTSTQEALYPMLCHPWFRKLYDKSIMTLAKRLFSGRQVILSRLRCDWVTVGQDVVL